MTAYTNNTRYIAIRMPTETYKKMELYFIDNQISNKSKFINTLVEQKLQELTGNHDENT